MTRRESAGFSHSSVPSHLCGRLQQVLTFKKWACMAGGGVLQVVEKHAKYYVPAGQKASSAFNFYQVRGWAVSRLHQTT